ncbi:hypothetical protein PSTG_14781 [Puccinia striiformis f. sp. tritici PST-78]|uniref:Uncharacterized protein n=1 Tax=Puccinia striiformis f. sp. tritici PST-78 TaxID=1165861 RepID=A0A0L0UY18_9BASI|nr:hypothetical protein PSTG_14781 [Puccinia striiformis f. sp. tritici PST-78]
MDPNPNPSDSQPVQDLRETSPGGIVESSEADSPPRDPSVTRVHDDEAAAAPGELLAFHAAEAQDDSAESNVPDPVQTNNTPTLEQVMQTLTPENRVTFRNFFDGTNWMAAEFVNNPNRRSFTPEETLAHVGDLGAIQRIAESLDQYTAALLAGFLTQAMQLHRVALARQNVARLLDDLTNTNLAAFLSAGPQAETPSCAVCVEECRSSPNGAETAKRRCKENSSFDAQQRKP